MFNLNDDLRFRVYLDRSSASVGKDIKNHLKTLGAEQFVYHTGLNKILNFSFTCKDYLSFHEIKTYLEYRRFVLEDDNFFVKIYDSYDNF
jgi:hypothetical protein